jgi:hypothetical protein
MPQTSSLLTSEIELLLQCVAPEIDTHGQMRIAHLAQQDLDWKRLLHLATHHRVKPLLYWRLQALCPDAPPQWLMHKLQRDFYANTRRSMFLSKKLVQLTELFADHDLPIVPYKGPMLAMLAYHNLALRQAGDLDILVHQSDLERATDLLVAHGATLRHTPEEQQVQLKHFYTFDFAYESIFVEMHWRFAGRLHSIPLSLHDVANRLTSISFAGKPVFVFAIEDLLLILCVHGMKHYWERLSWVSDIAWLLHTNPTIDWDIALERASQARCRRIFLLGVYLAHVLLDGPLPPHVLHQIRAEKTIAYLVVRLQKRMFVPLGQPGPSKIADLLYIMSRDRWHDKITYTLYRLQVVLNGVFIAREDDFAFLALPPSLSGLYYVIRPLRLLLHNRYRPLWRMRNWYNKP